MRPATALLLTVALLGCAANLAHERLTIATVTSSNAFGGEARFWGKLLERDGCLVAGTNESFATPIFDAGVTLAADRKTIVDVRHHVQVPIGRPFQAGAAWLRDDGQGWSIRDIESFYGTRLPRGCPTDDVIRLHNFNLTGEG